MAYQPTDWKNREVERPRTFTLQDNPDGTVTLIPAEGNVIEVGTPIVATNMNNIEQGVADAHDAIDVHLAEFVQQLGEGSGYQKLPNGLILQWGSITYSGSSGFVTGNFPISFPQVVFQVIAASRYIASTSITNFISAQPRNDSCVFYVRNINGAIPTNDVNIAYVALGY